ncbi:NAD-dependent dehydratase [Halobacteriales archaeon QS_5_70_17]|nr:MAG: NAD-dependent dehydratase [Halobacteriales archaeon QS_5_70_17]
MRVLVAGSRGQVGQHVTQRLAESDHEVRGMVRDGAQIEAVEALGAEAVLADLTEDVTQAQGAERFVMPSAINADSPEESPEALREYLRAKAEADQYLRESELTYTVVRPGSLTNEEGTGRIRTGADLDRESGDVPRADVAHTLVAALTAESTHGLTFEVLSGDEPVEDALRDPLGDVGG